MKTRKKTFTPESLRDLVVEEARRINETLVSSPDREVIFDGLEKALMKSGIVYEAGVWYPDSVGGMKLNCGFYLDFAVENMLAVMIAAKGQSRIAIESELRLCLSSGLFRNAMVLQFGRDFNYYHFEYNPAAGTWQETPGPAPEADTPEGLSG